MTIRTPRSPVVLGLRVVALALFASLWLPMVPAAAAGENAGWSDTGTLTTARTHHTATLLPDGRVLVAGGLDSSLGPEPPPPPSPFVPTVETGVPTANSEVYNPASGTWTPTCPLTLARARHTATLLPNGKVLVAGGFSGGAQSSAELFDPAGVQPITGCVGTWSLTAPMANVRFNHSATLLGNGKVLVASGHAILDYSQRLTNTAELYDPATATWTATGTVQWATENHTASTLADGRVLKAGGLDLYSTATFKAEIYDPNLGTWSNTDDMATQKSYAIASPLANGEILVAGGELFYWPAQGYRTSTIYNPTAGTWRPTGDLNEIRTHAAAVPLPGGRVLVAGGTAALGTAEVYDPTGAGTATVVGSTEPVVVVGKWNLTGSMSAERTDHTLTVLQNGKILAVGGRLPTSELYTPAPVPCASTTTTVALGALDDTSAGGPVSAVVGFGLLDGGLSLSAMGTASQRRRRRWIGRAPARRSLGPPVRMRRRRGEGGFTLIELLVVIVILGVLAAIVVFAVRGAGSKGRDEARTTEARIIRTAQEAYCAQAGQYASEAQLTGQAPADNGKTYKLLSDKPGYHEITANKPQPPGPCGGWSYAIIPIQDPDAECP